MENKNPRVIVPTINVWQDTEGDRTIPEIFANWGKDQVANIYTRAPLPDSASCSNYLQINETAVLKSIFKRGTKTTRVVENTKTTAVSEEDRKELLTEQKRYERARKKHSWFMTICREIVWLLGDWKTPELRKFSEDFDPQMFFFVIFPFMYINRIEMYLIKHFDIPVVGYLFDDNYTYKPCGINPLAYIHRFFLRIQVKRLVKECDELFVITPMQKAECDKLFSVDSTILTRAVDVNLKPLKQSPHKPLRMIYTGKLILGRVKTLAEIAKAIERINRDGEKIIMEIYSVDTPHKKYEKILNSGGTYFRGAVTADKIPELQSNSDIMVFAESLELQNKYAARGSFSTKITDYFLSGRCIFAVGDKDIAPMDYLKREDAAITVNSYKDIEDALRKLVASPELVEEYGKKALLCGINNHSKEKVLGKFSEVMLNTYNQNQG